MSDNLILQEFKKKPLIIPRSLMPETIKKKFGKKVKTLNF